MNFSVGVEMRYATVVVALGLLPAANCIADDEEDASEPAVLYAPAVVAKAEYPEEAIALLWAMPKELLAADVTSLEVLDRGLDVERSPAKRQLSRQLLVTLAATGDLGALGYVHQVFETVPWRRQDVARAIAEFAIAKRRRAEDWRLLVRAVPVVEGDDVTIALKALGMFPHRGTKPHWQREVILAGLRGDDATKVEAVRLLRHWTGTQMSDERASAEMLEAWQKWFDETHPELPAPMLPIDNADSKYKSADLLAVLDSEVGETGNAQHGALVFEKAQCVNCHRFGKRGEAMGPDLTNTRQWLQLKQLVEAIVFPSQSITDQYETTTIITKQGQVYSGVLAADGDNVVVLQASGKKAMVDRRDIDETLPSRKSSMPDGLLEPLTLEQVVDLFAYLQHGER